MKQERGGRTPVSDGIGLELDGAERSHDVSNGLEQLFGGEEPENPRVDGEDEETSCLFGSFGRQDSLLSLPPQNERDC